MTFPIFTFIRCATKFILILVLSIFTFSRSRNENRNFNTAALARDLRSESHAYLQMAFPIVAGMFATKLFLCLFKYIFVVELFKKASYWDLDALPWK